MKKHGLTVFTVAVLALASVFAPVSRAAEPASDPDVPGFLGHEVDKGEYLRARAAFDEERYGGSPSEQLIQARIGAVRELGMQASALAPFAADGFWSPIGPWPIPNGQTTTVTTAVSGRVTAIAVHPTNADIVFVGTAQGGVWRSLNGGASWTPIFDGAASLSIGSLAIAPSNPTILYVGTGEANLSADSYFGVGLYRVENATSSPVLSGPFNPTPTNDVLGAKAFTGRSISKILVDASDPATVFCAVSSGVGGVGGEALGASPPVTALRGIYRSTDGTSSNPSFTKLTVTASSSVAPDVTGNLIVTDMAYDPADVTGNTIVCWVYGTTTALNGGIYRTTNARAATPAFTQTFVTTVSNVRGTFAVTRAGGVTTMIVGTGELATGTSCTTGSGALRRSTDGGVTWSAKLAGGGGYCGGQCFYDLPVAISPVNANIILIGGAGNSTCSRVYARSTDGGATFTAAGVGDLGLHADAHAIEFAPSNANIVYEGNDGGIYKSTDAGATWTSLNVYPFSATQFQSLDVHPTNANFSIGGTQDNGTNFYSPSGVWDRVDFGDGGFAVIDQNATDTTNVRMYHTYYNQRNAVVAYASVTTRTDAFDGNWPVYGQGANGILLTEYCQFYAPLVRGPGSPLNTIYYGTDRLHRSADGGLTNPTVSQAPIGAAGIVLTAIGIAPSNDNVRLVATSTRNYATGVSTTVKIMGTVTGSSTLLDWTAAGMPTTKYCSRIAVDPVDPNKAYVCFGGFGVAAGQHIWKTTNLMSGAPVWAASGTGLPDVPVNAFDIDPANTQRLFAGTDVGMYTSLDGGATWAPYTTGMPVVAVFDMKVQPSSRTLRVATHGRGLWERALDPGSATDVDVVATEIVNGHPRMTWHSSDASAERVRLYRREVPGDMQFVTDLTLDASGRIEYEDASAQPGRSYEYQVGVVADGVERVYGRVWVDVPLAAKFALRSLSANPARGSLQLSVTVGVAAPASLELVDGTGRRVAGRDLGAIEPGEHRVSLETGAVPAGVYFARLSQAGKVASVRVTIVR